jgi:hypothetical protein
MNYRHTATSGRVTTRRCLTGYARGLGWRITLALGLASTNYSQHVLPENRTMADTEHDFVPGILEGWPRVGDVWIDRDPRSPNRVEVLVVEGGRVLIQRPSKKVWVSATRFTKAFRRVVEARRG